MASSISDISASRFILLSVACLSPQICFILQFLLLRTSLSFGSPSPVAEENNLLVLAAVFVLHGLLGLLTPSRHSHPLPKPSATFLHLLREEKCRLNESKLMSTTINGRTQRSTSSTSTTTGSMLDYLVPEDRLPPLSSLQPRCISLSPGGKVILQLRSKEVLNGLKVVLSGKTLSVVLIDEGKKGVQVKIEVDVGPSSGGLMSINVWSSSLPSSLTVTQQVLLLIPGWEAAAKEISEVVTEAYSTPYAKKRQGVEVLLADIALLMEGSDPLVCLTSHLKVVAMSVLSWAEIAGCTMLEEKIRTLLPHQEIGQEHQKSSLHTPVLSSAWDSSSIVPTIPASTTCTEALPSTCTEVLPSLFLSVVQRWPSLLCWWSVLFSASGLISQLLKEQGLNVPNFLSWMLFFCPYIFVILSSGAAMLAKSSLLKFTSTGPCLSKLQTRRQIIFQSRLLWLLGDNVGVILQLHRVFVTCLISANIIPTITATQTTLAEKPFLYVLMTLVMSLFEAYNIELAAAVTIIFHIPTWILVLSRGMETSKAVGLSLILAVVSTAARVLMSCLQSNRRLATQKVQGKSE